MVTGRRRHSSSLFFFILRLSFFAGALSASSASVKLPSDAAALLAFKSGADLRSNLPYSSNTSLHYCQWVGVMCVQGRVSRLVVEGFRLNGVIVPDSLSRLDQLRVLSLQNNSLTGPIPDLSGLVNLKTLFLDHNKFTGSFPPSIFILHRIRTIDLSYNHLAGPLPLLLTKLDRLNYLRLDSNFFNGTIPAFNQSSLQTFNVSGNNLTGAIPVTPVLSRFGSSSYSGNPGLCGEILHEECRPGPPFFESSPGAAPPPRATVLGQSAELHGVNLTGPPPSQKKQRKIPLIIGFSCGVVILIGSIVCFAVAVRKQRKAKAEEAQVMDDTEAVRAAAMLQMEQENELEEKIKRVQGMQVGRSGNLVFCAGEAHLYSLEQLMRASAELLGRGTVGTTYKAVLDNRLIVCVKRLDSSRLAGTSKEAFERHMESVGGLRHPNLVPLRAYLQAKEERLLVYDYQPNGSLHSLIHGSKSSRAKPLHWTSCLKIAEDVAQGLSYIHQAWRLVHGNLKSSNVLLGPDFEACISDYCLTVLSDDPYPPPSDDTNPDYDLMAYRAPETHQSQQPTNKSDIYAFGVLLLELLTSKPPSKHPDNVMEVEQMMNWVRSTREDDGVGGDDKLEMLLEVALACTLRLPDQRPTMWQVLKMLQEIKEGLVDDENEQFDPHAGVP